MEQTTIFNRSFPTANTHHHLPSLLRTFRSWLDERGYGDAEMRIPQLIDKFTRDLHDEGPSGRAARSMLLNHLVADTRSVRASGVALHRYPDRPNSQGYTLADERELRDAAESEASQVRRHAMCVTLALAAGCGLKASEVSRVELQDLTVDDCVGVRIGSLTVPCRGLWAGTLKGVAESRRAAARGRGTQLAMLPEPESGGQELLIERSYRIQLVHQTPLAGRLVSFKRLRTTFVVRHLEAGTPAKHIVAAARFASPSALTRYIELVEQPSDADLQSSMGGVR